MPQPAQKDVRTSLLRRFIVDRRGATAIEYGLVVGLIALASLAALKTLGGSVTNMYSRIANATEAAAK